MIPVNGAPIISKQCERYTYKNKLSLEAIILETIKLPIDSSGNPDWNYMEQYMAAVLQESEQSLQKMEKMGEKRKVETSGWARFRIEELFSCELAKGDIQAPTAKEGKYPLVSAGNPESSGIVKYISERDDSERFSSGADSRRTPI